MLTTAQTIMHPAEDIDVQMTLSELIRALQDGLKTVSAVVQSECALPSGFKTGLDDLCQWASGLLIELSRQGNIPRETYRLSQDLLELYAQVLETLKNRTDLPANIQELIPIYSRNLQERSIGLKELIESQEQWQARFRDLIAS